MRHYIANLSVGNVVWFAVLTGIIIIGAQKSLMVGLSFGACFLLGTIVPQQAESRWPGRGGRLFQVSALVMALCIAIVTRLLEG